MALLTIGEAVKLAGVSGVRIRQLLNNGRIMGTRVDDTFWLVNSQSLQNYIDSPRKPGRPLGWRKAKPDEPPKKRRKRRKSTDG